MLVVQAPVELVQAESRQSRQTFSVRLKDQQAVDEAVDRLRAAGVSLIRIGRRATTLEDAFLQIVGDRQSDSEAADNGR